MEIGDGLRQRLEGIVNLVIHDGLLVRKILQGDAAPGQKGHLPVAVEGAARIHADSHGADLGILVPSHAEEVAHRAFHGWMRSAKLFENGRSQAVRLPKECRFSGEEVAVNKIGDIVILMPKDDNWSGFLDSLNQIGRAHV